MPTPSKPRPAATGKRAGTTLRRRALPKVSAPRLARIAPRAPLAKALLDATEDAAAWVQAPGGAGKTTAVAALATDLKLPVAWLHADPGDAQLASFFHFLAIALGTALPRAARSLPAYGTELEPECELFARRFARSALEASKDTPVVLAIDNLQDIPAGSRVHGALAALVEEVAGPWRVFLMTREPPGPAYSKLLGQGRLVPVAGAQLAFAEGELKEALRLRGILDERRLDELWSQSGGWIAGALLLAMGPGKAAGGAPGPGSSDTAGVFAYFADQAFSRLDPDDRRLLVSTAFLPTVRPEAAARLSGLADATARLGAMASRGLLVTRFDREGEGFRCHDLFREFLRAEAGATLGPAQLRDLQRESARQLAAGDEPLAALALLFACADWAGIREVVMARAETLLGQGHARSLADLLARVPAEERDRDPWLQYWLAQCHTSLDDGDAVGPLIRAHGLFGERGDAVGQLVAGVAVPMLMRNHNQYRFDFPAWIAKIEAIADRAWEVRSPFLALRVLGGLASLVPLSPFLESWADRIVAGVAELLPRVDDPNASLQAATQAVGIGWRLRRAEFVPPIAAQVEALRLEQRASPLLALHWLYDLITFDSMYGDTARATANARRCEEIAKSTGLAASRFEALLLRLEVACDRNEVDEARRLLAALERHADPARPVMFAWINGFKGRIALLRDEPEDALAACRAAIGILKGLNAPMQHTSTYFSLDAGAHALAGRHAQALASCRSWREVLAEPQREVVDLYEAWIRAAQAAGEGAADARPLLESAIAAARRLNYPLPLRHANRLVASLCAKAIEWSLAPDFVAAMIARRGLAAPDAESPAWPWPVRVRCLGRFEIERAGEAVVAPGRNQKTVELLQAAIAMGGAVPVDRLVPVLWPGEGRVGAQHALETALYRLRKLLGSDTCVAVVDRQLVLDRREAWVDALALEGLLDRLDAGAEPPDDAAVRAIGELHAGPFLPQRAREPWAAEARARIWTRVRRVMVAAARRARERGDGEQAERLLYFVIDRQAVAEDAFAELMRVYLARGQPAEALFAFRRCAAALASELGLEPGPELRALAAETGGKPAG